MEKRLEGRRPTLLLHSCCGPCSSAVLERLTEHFRVTLLYYNPNIEPEAEYLHRLNEQKRLLELLPGEIPLLPCGYDNAAFEAFAPAMADAPEGGERCLACFALRLDYTAAQAKEHGFEYFTTTLSVSAFCEPPQERGQREPDRGGSGKEARGEIPLCGFQEKERIPAVAGAVEGIRAVPAGLLRMPVFDEP